ncbi:MAG: S8/S53 family peptidase [Nanoarchaeota archaeon]|nr:S8/S53 family peptidase [Nanoarchaeota archaeon]
MNKTRLLAYSFLTILALSLVMVLVSGKANNSHDSKVTQHLLDKFEAQESVQVLVILEGAFTENQASRQDFDKVVSKLGEEKVLEEFFPQGFTAELTKKEVLKLSRDHRIQEIAYDELLELFMQDVVQITEVQRTWNRHLAAFPDIFPDKKFTGNGQSICIIDTGIDFTHPDLAPNNILGCNLECHNGDPSTGLCILDCSATDQVGHGTAMAGIAAANGVLKGIAPKAKIISLKITNSTGGRTARGVSIIKAVLWCTQNADTYNISAISISFGHLEPSSQFGNCDGVIPLMTRFVNNATDQGISVVAATGNGWNYTTIAWPACISNVIPVSAAEKFTDNHAPFANSNQLVKLFGVSPFVNTTAASQYWPQVGMWGTAGGTSSATPQVAATIVIMNQILDQLGESLTPQELESALHRNGDPVNNILGANRDVVRINVDRTVLNELDPCERPVARQDAWNCIV